MRGLLVWVRPKDQKMVGEVLAKARERAGLTQQQLAKRLAKPQSFISSYERGQRRVDVIEFLTIAQGIGVDARRTFASVRSAWVARR